VSNLQVTPITGLPQVDGWAQVVTHPTRLLICALSVAGKNANSVGKTLSEQITHFTIVDSAILHNDLLDLLQRARSEECQLQLACFLQIDGKSIVATNSGSAFLKRHGRIGGILASEGELKIIEGPQVHDDIFILATQQAATLFPDLKTWLSQDTEDLVPQLVADLQAHENSSLSALAWVEQAPATADEGALEFADAAVSSGNKFKLNFGAALQRAKNLVPSRLRKNPVFLAKRLISKIVNAVKTFRERNNNILGEKPKTLSKNFLIVGAAVILLLAGIIFWRQYQIGQELATLQPRFGELQQQFAQAKEVAESEPITARSETKAVMQGLEDLIAANPDKPAAIKALKDQYQLVQTFAGTIAGTETQDLEPFFDLRLAEANFVTKDLGLAGNTLLALDAAGGRAVLLDLTNKQTSQIVFDNIGTGRALAVDEDALYILADGLHQFELSENHPHTKLKDQGDSDRAAIILVRFNTYLYAFNPEERNLYRYLQNAEGLSDPIGWLTDKQGLEFDTVTSMAIDGDVWLTTNSGEVLKYTQGQPQNFSIADLATPFDSALKIATHPDSDYLFILEKTRHRLVLVRKDGSFFKEIVSDSLASAETLAASTAENAVYVVSGSLVYKISF
jgi:hypothetical protein